MLIPNLRNLTIRQNHRILLRFLATAPFYAAEVAIDPW
jgi:hypothetical protein